MRACGQRVRWSPTDDSRTTPFAVSWKRGALSPANAKQVRRAARAVERRYDGVVGAVRAAAVTLAGSDGTASIPRRALVDRVAATHPQYASVTVRQAIDDHVRAEDGVLVRLHVGVFALRLPGGPVREERVARDWVLEAPRALDVELGRPVTRREVEQQLTSEGLRYSARAVNQRLTQLVRDPTVTVGMTVDQRYRLDP